MPILGITASQISGHLTVANDYESIATVTVGSGGTSAITFSSIPSTYKHLQIRGILRSNPSYPDGEYGFVRVNGSSASIYSAGYTFGNGTVAGTGSFGGTATGWVLSQLATNDADLANAFGPNIWEFLDYADTNKFKTFRGYVSNERNGSGTINLADGAWRSTSAITSIAITPGGGTAWLQYSTLALYGIKG